MEALSLGPLQALQHLQYDIWGTWVSKVLGVVGEVIRKQGRESKLTITTSS